MQINETPIRTSNNFNLNSFNIDENLINKKVSVFNSIKSTYELIDSDKVYNLKYGIGLLDYISVNNNFNKEITIDTDGSIEFDLDNKDLVSIITLNIIKESNLYITFNGSDSFNNSILKINVLDNIKSNITLINKTSSKAFLLSIDSFLNNNSSLDFNIINISSGITVYNYYSLLNKENNFNLNTIYISKEKDKIDLNYIVEVEGIKNKVNMNIEGVLMDNSSKSFKGTINFKKGSSESIGSESENALLLSENARSLSLPIILTEEENIKGEHSSSSGEIDEKELFYLMSRGISEKDSIELIIKSRFNKLIKNIKDTKIKEEIEKLIDERI